MDTISLYFVTAVVVVVGQWGFSRLAPLVGDPLVVPRRNLSAAMFVVPILVLGAAVAVEGLPRVPNYPWMAALFVFSCMWTAGAVVHDCVVIAGQPTTTRLRVVRVARSLIGVLGLVGAFAVMGGS